MAACGSLKLEPQLLQCFELRYCITPSLFTPISYSWRVEHLLPIDCILLSVVMMNRAGRLSLWHTNAQAHEICALREIFDPNEPPSRLTYTLMLKKIIFYTIGIKLFYKMHFSNIILFHYLFNLFHL